ncbi:hypothetical protein PILCRDRAFT_93324 [Piloderma croceum F 1598]|uniref:Uncharacterized protein n=1 Tax=Piloderma croceum (strain F 1598) TaxID=765440 RepID=A0A0C3EJG5_PILCF|nr:hypothetical protein PILCRDRAFT_93324 [Piloderma croceum F 1598]
MMKIQAQEQYDTLYYDLDSNNKDTGNSTDHQNFHRPLQKLDSPTQHANLSVMELNEKSTLEGKPNSFKILNLEGCSFLGSKAIQVPAAISSLSSNPTKGLENPPKIKQGQKINLVQVIGNALISGFVSLDLFFQTPKGPVKINVEAYVVKGMSTPFILGNDFTDQYSISILQQGDEMELEFIDSRRRMRIENSTLPSLINEHGQTFKVQIMSSFPGISSKKSTH